MFQWIEREYTFSLVFFLENSFVDDQEDPMDVRTYFLMLLLLLLSIRSMVENESENIPCLLFENEVDLHL